MALLLTFQITLVHTGMAGYFRLKGPVARSRYGLGPSFGSGQRILFNLLVSKRPLEIA